MNWKQIKQPEDPDWVEWHKEVMSPEWGRVMLKVWQNMEGYFNVSMTFPYKKRFVKALDSTTIEAAKLEAEKWARGE